VAADATSKQAGGVGSSLSHNEVGPAVYVDFLPDALATGRYRAAPKPHLAGTGLRSVQTALDIQRNGISAKKIVVSLAPEAAEEH